MTTTRLRRGTTNVIFTAPFRPRSFATRTPVVVALERSIGAAAEEAAPVCEVAEGPFEPSNTTLLVGAAPDVPPGTGDTVSGADGTPGTDVPGDGAGAGTVGVGEGSAGVGTGTVGVGAGTVGTGTVGVGAGSVGVGTGTVGVGAGSVGVGTGTVGVGTGRDGAVTVGTSSAAAEPA